MAVLFVEPGGDATGGTQLCASPGNMLASTAQAHTGSRSLALSATVGVCTFASNVPTAGRASVYVYATLSPRPINFFNGAIIGLRVGRSGTEVTLRNNTAQIAISSGADWTQNAWHRVSVAWSVTSTTVYTIKVWFNGVLVIDLTNGTALSTATFPDWESDQTTSGYLDDLYLDNDTSLTDPGDIRVCAKKPAGLGSNNAFSTGIGSGTNRWDRVSEVPLSTTNGWESSSAQQTEAYAIEAVAVGDDLTGATIVARQGWMLAKRNSGGGAGTPQVILDGTGTGVTLSTTAGGTIHKTAIDTTNSYPSAGNQIGMRSSGVHSDQLYECGVILAYIPSSGPTSLATIGRPSRSTRALIQAR